LSDWLGAGFGNMQGTLQGAYGQLNNGMNQFYGSIPRDGAGLLGSALQQGSGQIGSLGSQMGSAYNSFNNANSAAQNQAYGQLGDIMDRVGEMTPSAGQNMQFQMQDARNARIAQQRYATVPYMGGR
jgi:hypothetical protein